VPATSMPPANGMHRVALGLFKGLATAYDKTVDYATFFQDRYWKGWVAKKGAFSDGALVLDLGCGTLLLEERLRSLNCSFVGLDVTAEMARLGVAKGLANVSGVINGDAEAIPFAGDTFDAAVSCYVPKYVSVAKLADELARVVKPEAMVVLYDFARPSGIRAPFLELYIQVGLRAIGLVLRKTGNRAAFAFEKLPQIVDGTSWDKAIVRAMEERGFNTIDATPLTGGVVFAYCGQKRAERLHNQARF
jgi:demethylmenaquinone methyltransferase / 2-methoxy-6-polyprenyl-1,4-benzoquinol methylase